VSKEEKMKRLPKAVLPLVLLAAALPAAGQTPPLNLPQPSPEASVGQTVGLTEISIHYHRPAVNKRKVWGELVPYGEVWRAGANENTTFTVSSPVKVEGKALAAGTYGLHMIPTEKEWTVVFSKMSSAWGSFSYDPKEDALRVTVTPTKAPFEERLSYTLADPSNRAATMVLRWEETAVPVHIEIDTPSVVVESLRNQLRGLPRFSWQGWNGAAAYCLRNDVNLDEALQWADRSIQLNENFQNLRTKAGLLEKKGDTKTAETLRAKSLSLATEVDMNLYGYQLLGDRKFDEAIAVFRKNVKDHPNSWNTYDSLAEAYLTKGDKKLAAEYYNQALAMTQDETQKKRISTILAGIKA
jgi:tetratricopeptide (TPR) repeat protein